MTVVTLRPGSQGPLRFDPNAPPADDEGVRNWSPNKRAYHSDGMATMIPSAEEGPGGASLGFASAAGVVQIGANPSTGRGGVPVDMAAISAANSAGAFNAAQHAGGTKAERIENAYRMMGVPVDSSPPQAEPEPAANPLVSPASYVTPAANLDGSQLQQGATMATHPPPPRVGQPPAAPTPAAQPVPVAGQPVAAAPVPAVAPVPQQAPLPVQAPPADNGSLVAMMMQQQAQTNQLMQHMLTALQGLSQPAPQPEVNPHQEEHQQMVKEARQQYEEASIMGQEQMEPVAPPPAQPTSNGRTYTRDQVVEVVGNSFDTLGIPRLGPDATKPSYLVNFDTPMGQLSARYHWVGVHGKGLFLIYDRRYEHGMEFVPPALGVGEDGRPQTMKVTCPEQGKSFTVQNPGFNHPFGKLLIINLIIVDEGSSGQLPIDEQQPMQLSGGESTELDVNAVVTLDQMLNNAG